MNNSVSMSMATKKFKVVFLGDQNVGKSSMLKRYLNSSFEDCDVSLANQNSTNSKTIECEKALGTYLFLFQRYYFHDPDSLN